jgi:hypothetical protein
MTQKRLACLFVSLLIAACSGSTTTKKKDGSADFIDGSGDTGGAGTGGAGTGGARTGGTGGGGIGGGGTGGGVVVEPPASDAGIDAMTDSGTDAQGDASTDGQGDASSDAQTDGGDGGICMPACTVGDKRCGTGGLQTCVVVNGCAAWGTEMACGANRTCTGTGAASACTCAATPAACTGVGTFCSSNTVRSTCEMVNGCLVLSATTKTCGPHQTCTAGLPAGDCVCTPTAGCTAAGTFCPTATTVGTCTQDAEGCFTKSGNDTTCMNGQVCVTSGATAACACPATVGTTLGTACQTVGQTVCSGDTVLTCAMNSTSGCKTWSLTTDCAAASGLTCGKKGGPAACECPAVTDGNYYVDPVAGNDASGAGPFPSGAKTPAACRFKTLSKATNIAVNTGNKIIAITASLPGIFTESAPISVAAGVTLTTDDAAPTPGNYRLDYTGSTGVAVSLANNSAISGFTIANGNTAINPGNPAVALGCTSGTVTVKSVTLDGTSPNGLNMFATGLQVGSAPLNTCTGTFDKVTADSFATGIRVSTSAGTAPIVTSPIVLTSTLGAIGMLVEAGTVDARDLVVKPSGNIAAAGFGVVVRPQSGVTAANFLGSNTSIQSPANDGVFLNDTGMLGPQATLTSALISNPTGAAASGIHVQAGTLNIQGATQILSADLFGLNVSGGTVIGTGLTISASTDDGVHVTGGSVTLHQSTIKLSHNRNVFMDNGAMLIDDGSAITDATAAGIEIAPSANDSFTLGGTTGALVDVSTNTGHGISLTGAGAASAIVLVQRTNIHDNSLNGINVNLTGNANGVSFLNDTVFANHQHGVVVTGAPATTAAGITFDTVEVRSHTGANPNGRGIWLHGNDAGSSNIVATINNSKVHGNRDTGIVIDEGSGNTTTESLAGNDIFANNQTGAATTVGGISFATSSTLSVFAANQLHSNGGDQIAFVSKPTTGTNWDINAPGACSTAANAQQNKIYCYTLTGAIGLRATAPNPAGAYTIDAGQITWANTTVMAGREFVQGANTTVTTTGPCTPAAICP